MKHKNFNLTKSSYLDLVQKLRNGDEKMFEHIFLTHFKRSVNYLSKNLNVSNEIAYDICMDTLIDFRKGLINQKYAYGNLNFLFTRMACQRFYRISKKNEKNAHRVLEETEETISPQAKSYFDEAWASLGANCKELLKKYYYDDIPLKEIAIKRNLNPNTLRKQKERCLNVLRINLQKLNRLKTGINEIYK